MEEARAMRPPQEAALDDATQLSADGRWWWDGERWVPAISGDGLWRWDGGAWQRAAQLDTSNPGALVEGLDRLLGARFAEGGHILALRAHEWRARDEELADLVARAAPLAARLAALDSQLAALAPAGGMLNLRHLLGGSDREQLEAEARQVETELQPLAALIGRMAPQPSLKDADELLVPARRLAERVAELAGAVGAERRLVEEHEAAVAAARRRLEEARARREAALREFEDAARARELEHARAVDDLAHALRRVRVPSPGEELARFEGAVLRDNRLDLPDGRAPLEGATARVARAAELWEQERAAVDRLGLLEAVHALRFQDSLGAGGDEAYLLVQTATVASLVPVAAGHEEAAAGFAAELEQAADRAPARAAEWAAQVAAAEAALEAAIADTSAVEEARAALEQAASDPERNAEVEAAEAELDRASTPPPEVGAARERMDAIAGRILEPPPPLR